MERPGGRPSPSVVRRTRLGWPQDAQTRTRCPAGQMRCQSGDGRLDKGERRHRTAQMFRQGEVVG